MGFGRSVINTLSDFSYLLNRDAPTGYKLRVTGIYLRLTAQFFFNKLRIKQRSLRILGREVHFPDFPTFAFLFREIFVKQVYSFKMERPVIIDCGANIGMSMLYFKHFRPDAGIYGFEPLPENFKFLKRNVGRLSKVKIYEAPVSTEEGFTTFFFDAQNPATLVTSGQYKAPSGKDSVKVKTVRLSSFIKRVKPDVLKMDGEGAESEILKDLDATGVLKNISLLVIEYHHNIGNNASFAEFLSILERNGFTYYVDSVLAPREMDQDILVYARR
jgi:FkbM family methyltransferase